MELNNHNYSGFRDYFYKNEEGAKNRYKDLHQEFESLFNQIIKLGCSVDFKSAQKGAGVVLFLRATKYLYTAHNLALQGHVEEARVLLRSVLELVILAHLVSTTENAFSLWEECWSLRVKHTDKYKNVNIPEFKDRKYKVSEIINANKSTLNDNPKTSHLIRTRGEFSEYYSHENLFNIVPRVEFGEKKSEIYIGNSFESENGRMPKLLQLTIDIGKDIRDLLDSLVPKQDE